ncbi:MAG: sporulation protein Cse60 [Thermoproteota archaeon]|nr:sporulation protein Cse60 [Thermoproteota archaeon]
MIFGSINRITLMEDINDFIKKIGKDDLKDIKYAAVSQGNMIHYSAMIIYNQGP